MAVELRYLLSTEKWVHAVKRRAFGWQARHDVALQPVRGLELIGTSHSSWYAPISIMTPEWIVYAVGAGKDVSFELGLIDRVGCEVHSFDPADGAAEYVASLGERRLRFHGVAVWRVDGELTMWRAADPNHIALSAANLQHTKEAVRVPCRSIDSIMAELGHRKIHLAKFTVDGAEYDLVDPESLHRWGVDVLNIVFLPSRPWRQAQRLVDSLVEAGYTPVARRDSANFCFVSTAAREQLLARHPA